ncbi:MAG: electron transfer flavoprotein subunit beta [Candidatus Dadabacteria bacterium]|nr:electron transfer flavoprotein subunit beta [Candidatus Dadabacteria bacterium]NIQ16241.1 electron transfer flavoprotein subunit beta [Candidatus Dadabacteria bacterium]
MKIVAYITQTQDTEARIQVSSDGDSIDTEGIKWIMDPYDEFAVEEALQTKEKFGGEVVVVAAGPARATEALRQALAMGADTAILIQDDGLAHTDSITTAKIVASHLKKVEGIDIIFTGMVVIDEESVQVKIQLAEELGLPHVALVSKVVDIKPDEKKIVCQKEVDGGSIVVEASLPAVITCPDAMNEPRYASLPGIMKAKKKPLEVVTLDQIDLDSAGISKDAVGKQGSRVKTVKLEVPVIDRKLKIIKGSDDTTVKGDEIAEAARELVQLLREDAKVI